MSQTVIVVIGLLVGLTAGALIVLLARPRGGSESGTADGLAQINARIDAMGSWLHKTQGQLQQTVHERLDAASARTGDQLQALNARLAVIDSAQKNITDLASQVTTLQQVLGNKQSRGAFGQGQMEAIIKDRLPKDCYDFQATLSNRARPDCCIYLPGSPTLVIDAKFPLEAVTAFREAASEEEKKMAMARVRQDLGKHIGDIAEKYLIPGETQDMALMFVPSESVYAELYDGFDDIFQKAYRAKVIIVSPSLLMLAVQVIQQIRKDARMREAADQIRAEVEMLVGDVQRLNERVHNLDRHFGQANKDIEQIVTSADKILSRGEKIGGVEFGGEAPSAEIIPAPMRKLEAGE